MLSFMAMDYFHKSPLLVYPLVALAIFMAVFFAITLRTVLTNKSRYEALAHLPLEGGAAPRASAARDEKEADRG